ncbi:capsid cement protein [Nocardia pseudovaccinii]|uniref:capsid cement protein n=1 Tax=Nocardia pseudovaccinii TaxID=189540 RepID=UPI0007A4EA50|nr:capsid cement protein [Nocardia pseudovaccinii]
MSDYLPLYHPADKVPCTTSAAVTAGQVLVVSGDDTVAPSSAAAIAFGVAAYDAASGAQTMAYRNGIHVLTASGTINANDAVIPAAAGAVAAIGSETNYNRTVGVALAAASGGKVKVALRLA